MQGKLDRSLAIASSEYDFVEKTNSVPFERIRHSEKYCIED